MPNAALTDTLSLILDDIRLHGAVFRESDLRAPWAVRLATPGLTSFHIVVAGPVWLLRHGAPALRLETGDIAILPGGLEHRVQEAADSRASPHDLMPELDRMHAQALRVGGDGAAARLLSGHFQF